MVIAAGTAISIAGNIFLVHGSSPYHVGFMGGPLSCVISYGVQFLLLLAYAATWAGLSTAIFRDLRPNIVLGLAGIWSTCAEWYAFDALHLASAFLGTSAQATSAVFSLTLTYNNAVTYAISSAAAVCVGNRLGDGAPALAKEAAAISQKFALLWSIPAAIFLFLARYQLAALISRSYATT